MEQSNWKVSSDNHSIGELVSYLIFWHERHLKAFKGETVTDIYDEEKNKETFKLNKGKDWQNAVSRLDSIQTEWERLIENATDEQIAKWNVKIANMAAYTAYHTVQIIYIRKNEWLVEIAYGNFMSIATLLLSPNSQKRLSSETTKR